MPKPVKDKNSGIFYFRVRVPVDLVNAFGRKEISKSLRTREPSEAKERFAFEYALFQKQCSAFRAAPAPLPLKQIVSLAGRVYHEFMAALEDEPGELGIWEQVRRLNEHASQNDVTREQWYGSEVDKLLLDEGIRTDAASRQRLLTQVQRAFEQATEQQYKRAQGDFSPDPEVDRFPEYRTENGTSAFARGITLTSVFERWAKDHVADGKSANTVNDFAQKIDALKDYLGHDDIDRMTPKKISEWCDYLRHEQGLTPKTVAGKYLAAVRSVCRHAQSKFLITNDPTQGINIKVPKKVRSRPKGYTDDEAKRILSCANLVFELGSKASFHNKLACRWVPWICAYTGARVAEITQLRTQDLTFESGIPQITITPEAGTVKAGHYRVVPIHPHLQEIGLIDFIQSAKDGYLFHSGAKTKKEALSRAGNARDKVAGWVRETVGIVDKRVQPNHAWRHRFKTEGRNAGIAVDYLGAIQGHASNNAGEAYGEYSIETLYREVCKLHRIDVG